MMDEDAAERIAIKLLRTMWPPKGDVLVVTGSERVSRTWVVYWNSGRHVQSGDWLHALGGNAPILVSEDGRSQFSGTAQAVAEYVSQFEAQALFSAESSPFNRGEVPLSPRQHLQFIHWNLPRTLGADVTFSEAVKYVQGFDDATDCLDGFHAWLVERLGGGRSLFWSGLVVHDCLGTEPNHYSTPATSGAGDQNQRDDAELVNHLFDCIDAFFEASR